MRKHLELSDPNSCMSRAGDNEMTFVLLGRDAAAPTIVRLWTKLRIEMGKNTALDPQIVEALEWANTVEAEQADAAIPRSVAECIA